MATLSPWELKELNCIYDYLVTRFKDIVIELGGCIPHPIPKLQTKKVRACVLGQRLVG